MALPRLDIEDDEPQGSLPKLDIEAPEQPRELPKLDIEEEPGGFRRFMYGFHTMPSFSEGVGDYLERRFPKGRFQWYTPGQGYHAPRYVAPPTEVVRAAKKKNYALAKQILDEQQRKETESMFPVLSQEKDQQGGAAELAGSIASALLDPTTLIPVGQGAKMAYAASGLIGAADAAAYGLSMDDEIDPALTALGATGAIVGVAGVRYLGGKMSRMMQAAQTKSANKIARDFEHFYSAKRQEGAGAMEAVELAKKEFNLNEDALAGLSMKLGRKLELRKDFDPVDMVAEEAKANLRKTASKFRIPREVTGISKTIDDYLGTVSTRIKGISAPIWGRLTRLDFAEHYNTQKAFEAVQPFIDDLGRLKKQDKTSYLLFKKALNNQDRIGAERILRKFDSTALTHFEEVKKVLKTQWDKLEEAGHDMTYLDNYFPRVINDIPKLMKALGDEGIDIVKKARQAGIAESSTEDMAAFINRHMRGRMSKTLDTGPGFTRHRKIDEIEDFFLDQYADPEAALHSYLRRTSHDIERRLFFGQNKVGSVGGADIDVNASVGNLINRELQAGNLQKGQDELLEELLVARFDMSNRVGSHAIQGFRNVAYMSTIGNPVSALTQIGDIGVSAFAHGLFNTLVSVFGKKAVRATDLGIDQISQEFASTLKTAKLMDWVFRKSGFKWVDHLGKNTSINAALRKWNKAVMKPKGIEQLRKQWAPVFGNEMDDLIADLQNNRISANVKMLLFSELSDLQPISLSQMPLKYLRSPDGRVFYMLKTFTLKQLDIMRRNIWQEFNQGSKKKAMTNAVRYLGLVGMFNLGAEMSKEALLTGEINVDAVPDIAVANLIKNFGASEYLLNKYGPDSKLGSMAGEMIMPPLNVVDGLLGIFTDPSDIDTHMKHMPLMGKMWYYYMGDGIERLQQRREKEKAEEFKEMFDLGDLDLGDL